MRRDTRLLPACIAIGLLGLSALACTPEPLSKRVGRGSSVGIALNRLREGVTVGFGSPLAGADPQRGRVEIVLCRTNVPGCDPSTFLSPRQGYRMSTSYVTRAEVDSTARSRGSRLEGVVFEVPSSGPEVPPPGVYRVEPRVVRPGTSAGVALVESDSVRTIEITAEVGRRTPLTDPGAMLQMTQLLDAVPRPALRVNQGFAAGQMPAAAADVTIDFPSNKVEIIDAVPTPAAQMTRLVRVDQDTVRVIFVRDDRLPSPGPDVGLEQGFDLVFQLRAGATPVSAGDFAIRSTSYAADGARLTDERFGLPYIF